MLTKMKERADYVYTTCYGVRKMTHTTGKGRYRCMRQITTVALADKMKWDRTVFDICSSAISDRKKIL